MIEEEKPADQKTHPIIVANALTKSFKLAKEAYPALRGIDVKIYKGDFTIIFGASGSGKSTLLNCLIGLETPTSGEIWIDGQRFDKLKDDQKSLLRSTRMGVIHQQPIWIKALTILENVALPLMINGAGFKQSNERAKKEIEKVGLEDYLKHKPTEISGGQQQKVSLARALVTDPEILFLDEPTGNLDTHSSDEVMQLLLKLNKEQGKTIVMITHNLIYLPLANRTISITDGRVDSDSSAKEAAALLKRSKS